MPSFNDIPIEIVHSHLAPLISSSDLLSLSLVNIHCYNSLRFDNLLWFTKFKQLFKDRSSQSISYHQIDDWFKFFISRKRAKLWSWGTGSLGYSSREVDSTSVNCSSIPKSIDRISDTVVITDLAVCGKCGTKFAFLTEDGEGFITHKKFIDDEFTNSGSGDSDETHGYIHDTDSGSDSDSSSSIHKTNVECSDGFLIRFTTDDIKLSKLYSSATSPFLIGLDTQDRLYIWDLDSDIPTPMKLELYHDDADSNTRHDQVTIDPKEISKFSMDHGVFVFKYNNSLMGFKNTDIELNIKFQGFNISKIHELIDKNSADITWLARVRCKLFDSIHEDLEDFTIHDNICLYTTRSNGNLYCYSLLTSSLKQYPCEINCRFDRLYTSCSITTVVKTSDDTDVSYHNILNDRPIISNLQYIGFARGPSHFLCYDKEGNLYSFGSDDSTLGYLGLGDLEYSYEFCKPIQVEVGGKCIGVEAGSSFSCALIV